MIKGIQIDTNALCGSNCWYCPVRYYTRPTTSMMSSEMFSNIISQLKDIPEVTEISLTSYSDILLDSQLHQRLSVLRMFGYNTHLLSNGIGLIKNIELLDCFRNEITGFTFNIPAGNTIDYERYTLNDSVVFNQVINGVKSLIGQDPDWYIPRITIMVNSVHDDPYERDQLKIQIPLGDSDKQVMQLMELIPDVDVLPFRPLCDRAGLLRQFSIDNSHYVHRLTWALPVRATQAVGCNGRDRLNSWLHVTSNGDIFTCPHDFLHKHVYANTAKQTLNKIINSQERLAAIKDTQRDLCLRCHHSY